MLKVLKLENKMRNLEDVDWSQLPVPKNDGGADHLTGFELPSIALRATDGASVDLSTLKGRSVVYIYPRTGRTDQALPTGWDAIAGARGCTPQSCQFREHASELKASGADHLFGLSVQSTNYQNETVERLHLPFALLSDEDFTFCDALNLPTFVADDMRLNKRMTLIIDNGTITHVFYPVFPPDANAGEVINWLKTQQN